MIFLFVFHKNIFYRHGPAVRVFYEVFSFLIFMGVNVIQGHEFVFLIFSRVPLSALNGALRKWKEAECN